MGDRDRRVKADWGQIQSTGRDLEALAKLLQLERGDLQSQIEPLKLSVENGCIEYKLSLINSVFRELENERYKSLSSATLDRLTRDLGIIVYVVTIQRLLADGQLPLRDRQAKHPDDSPDSEPSPTPEIKDIIADVQERVKEDPALRMNQPVKNILMQLSRYSKEMNDFREVTARMPEDKKAAVGANFRKTTDEIFASLRKNYEQFLAAEQAALPKQPQNILLRIDLKSMVPIFVQQARETAAVRASLMYARDEQYGTRELLIELAARHPSFQKLIEAEASRYRKLGGTASVSAEISRAMNAEIGKRIQREIEYF